VIFATPRSGASLFKKILELDTRFQPDEIIWDYSKIVPVNDYLKLDPKTKFIFVTRNPIPTISSIIDGWRSQKYITHPELDGWWGEKWSFALINNWGELVGKPLTVIATAQFESILELVINEFKIANRKVGQAVLSSLEDLLKDPDGELRRISKTLDLDWNSELPNPLPAPTNTALPLGPEKVRKNLSEIISLNEKLKNIQKTESDFRISSGLKQNVFKLDSRKLKKEVSQPSSGTAFQSSHTKSIVELLFRSNSSLVVSTYKSGHLIFIRPDKEKSILNTSFRKINRPMGLAIGGSRLSIGAGDSIINYSNQPGLKAKIDPENNPDKVYALRSITQTGDVAIHEMGYDKNGELWFVNTKFSCLSKQQLNYSFNCEWKPEWITELAAEDRCHLNGLAFVNGGPKFVTALGQTNNPGGWRENKGSNGLLIDIQSNKIINSSLSMPHSPRWHQQKLWVLESGKGSLATVDLATGSVETIIELPGFTRGLTFIGPFALVGLSQVRETIFKELPLTDVSSERYCGVWVVDTRSKTIAGFIKFEGAVQEIFDVQVLPNTKWPMILDNGPETLNSFVLDDDTLKLVRKK
jgi:uncharacterized protein (TIGR03032 family)